MHTHTQCAYAYEHSSFSLWHIHFIGMYYTLPPLLAACSTLSTRGQAGWPRRRGKWGREGEVRADGPQIHFCLWCWRSTHKEPGHKWLLNGLLWHTFVNSASTIESVDTQRMCTDLAELLCHTEQKETKSLTSMKTRRYFFNPASFIQESAEGLGLTALNMRIFWVEFRRFLMTQLHHWSGS